MDAMLELVRDVAFVFSYAGIHDRTDAYLVSLADESEPGGFVRGEGGCIMCYRGGRVLFELH